MAKKKLSTEQKIQRYRKRRKIILAIKILIVILVILAMIPATYFGYYYVTFTMLPQNDYDPDKTIGAGYSKPLHMMHNREGGNSYVLAYYYNDYWHVIDDTEKLWDSREKFMIYKKDDEWHEGTHLQLMLIKDTYMYDNLPLCPQTLIDDRCFRDCTKKMTMEEFKNYVSEHGFTSVYIK